MKKISFIIPLFLLFLLQLNSCQDNPYQQGEIMYTNFCTSCHMSDGSGLEGVIPPLAGSDYIKANPARVACIVRYGQQGEIVVNGRTYNEPMAAIPQLTDFEITNIINYINHAWGNDFGYTKLETVQAAIDSCKMEKKRR